MKQNIKGFFIILTVILAIVGGFSVWNLAYCGLETCGLVMDRQTVLMLRDQKYLLEEANDKFAATQSPQGTSKKEKKN